MMRAAWLLLLCVICLGAQTRRVAFPEADFGDYKPIPRFDNGYLLSAPYTTCELTVFEPGGKKSFTRKLQAPGGLPCRSNDAALGPNNTFAVAIAFEGPTGFTGAILLLDAAGKTVSVIETGRYEPSSISFDRHHSLWSIGSKRDDVNGGFSEKGDYFLVRRFSKDGQPSGEFILRSLWGFKGDPGSAGRGYWHLAAARDRMAAIVHESFSGQTPELIEWDFDGKLLARTPIEGVNCGRAYTASGKLYGRNYDRETTMYEMFVLDTDTRKWKSTGERQYMGEWGLLLGAQGDELVFRAPSGSDLIWRRP